MIATTVTSTEGRDLLAQADAVEHDALVWALARIDDPSVGVDAIRRRVDFLAARIRARGESA